MHICLKGQTAIVTGAGAGLGRSHALALAARGARVCVNDLNLEQAAAVAQEIIDKGGKAMPFAASVADMAQVTAMVDAVIDQWGSIDILVNNAGILRDRTFAKMDLADFRLVLDVHLMGSVNCTKAVWDHMRARNYGRIVFTTSSSGLYGNFGQSNYGAAKMALVGLMQTLALEGARNDIRVNCLAPSAATSMTENLFSEAALNALNTNMVSPAVIVLVAKDAPTRRILLAGAGSFEQANITMTQGMLLSGDDLSPEGVAANFAAISDRTGETVPQSGGEQSMAAMKLITAAQG